MKIAIGWRRLLSTLVALTALCAVAAAPARADDDGDELTVMSRNLYFGADLGPVITAPNPPAFFAAVAAAYTAAQATDFAGRAKAWAKEIDETDPDLIGLQEAVLWRTQTPADFSPTPNATAVAADFVQLLLNELRARGLRYSVAATQTGYDVEAPGLFPFGFMDVRLTQREVILVRKGAGLRLSNVQGGQYTAKVTVPTAVGPIPLPWAWASVDVQADGNRFRFATTHLDPTSGAAQVAQAAEFLAGPGNTALPLVWVGDFNSLANGEPVTGAVPATFTYPNLIAAGFIDAWREDHPSDPGFTCCHASNLLNPAPTLDERIDLVLFRGPFEVREAEIVGEHPDDRLASGLWPSDHAGVVATLQFEEEEDDDD